MDWIACPGCGTRYQPTDPGCPSCARSLPAATLRALAAEQARRPPRRDLLLFALHAAFAACLLWAATHWRVPRWFFALAGLELAVAGGALVRLRIETALVHLRGCVYGTLAGALLWSPAAFRAAGALVLLLPLNAATVWWFGRLSMTRAEGPKVPAAGEATGIWYLVASVGDHFGGSAALLPAVFTWVIMVGWLFGLAH